MPSRKPKIEQEAGYLQSVEEIDCRFDLVKRKVAEFTKGRVADYDPVVAMACMANDVTIKEELRATLHNKVAEFVYPKVRSLDFTNGSTNEVKIAIHIAPYARKEQQAIEIKGRVVDD